MALLSLGQMGCLITEKITFEPERNCPPSIESAPLADHPLNEVIVIDTTMPDSVPEMIELSIAVRDCNVDDDLQIKVFLDDLTRPVHEQQIMARRMGTVDGGPTEPGDTRLVDVVMPLDARLRDVAGCHRLEMLASSLFLFGSREPAEEGDIGTAVWWVGTKTEASVSFDPSTCPTRSSAPGM